jgi:hypothetical protein
MAFLYEVDKYMVTLLEIQIFEILVDTNLVAVEATVALLS